MSNDTDTYRLWRHANGTWYVIWSEASGTKRLSTGTKDRNEAERYRAKFIAGANNPKPPEGVDIDHLLERYKEEHGKGTRSLETIEHNMKPLIQFFGKLTPSHLSNGLLKDYASFRKEKFIRGRPISDGTILRELGTLKAAIGFAAGNKWILPIPDLQAPVNQPPPTDIWLSKQEAQRLINSAKSPHIRLFIMIALYTAARTGAVLDLRWENINMERKIIDFGRGWGNKRRSIVPMNDDLYTAIKEAKELATSDYVIEYAGTGVKSIKSAFRRLSKDTKIPCSPHVLRHTAATWLVMDGVPIAEVARLLGDSEKTVEKVYGKHAPDYLRRAVSTLALGVA